MLLRWTQTKDDLHIAEDEKALLTEGSLLVDIETTGFTPRYQTIYLIGCAAFTDDRCTITQFFAQTPADEEAVLMAFAQLLGQYSVIITFNGERFDIPFLMARAALYHIELHLDQMKSIDIYKHVIAHKKLLGLSSYSQKSIEVYLGIRRDDKMSGGELIDVYKEYGRNPDQESLSLLRIHNYDDVCGLFPLLTMLRYDRLIDARLTIDYEAPDGQNWDADGSLSLEIPTMTTISGDFGRINLYGNRLHASFICKNKTMKYFLPEPQSYYYLPEEDIIIPKELGTSIDSSRREAATRRNCYQKKNGSFIICPKELTPPAKWHLFKENYEDQTRYIMLPNTDRKRFFHDWITLILNAIS